jgi:hypothetical protein
MLIPIWWQKKKKERKEEVKNMRPVLLWTPVAGWTFLRLALVSCVPVLWSVLLLLVPAHSTSVRTASLLLD